MKMTEKDVCGKRELDPSVEESQVLVFLETGLAMHLGLSVMGEAVEPVGAGRPWKTRAKKWKEAQRKRLKSEIEARATLGVYKINSLLELLEGPLHSRINALCKVFNVATVQSSHRDPSIHRQVYMCLLSQRLALFRLKASESVNQALVWTY